MRLLHTSDWHLGQHFMGKSRQPEHQALINWLLSTCAEQQVDAVIIAGDVFDTGAPPSYARELYNQLVLRLHEAGVGLLVLGGNHDSPAVLGESQALLACLGTQVVPAADQPAAQVQLLKQRNGQAGCIVCAIPFIRPRDLLTSSAGQSGEEKQAALLNAIAAHYGERYAEAQALQARLAAECGPLPIIATGHLTTVGASASESVREIYVGALEAFPTTAFPPVSYLALGHIHRPQKIGGHEHLRYSGSPLPLSFDEASQQKEMLLVELSEGSCQVTPLPVPRFQALVTCECTLAELPARIGSAAAQGSYEQPAWLEITIAADDYLPDLPARVQAVCEGLPVEVLRIRKARGQRTASLQTETHETLDELSPEEVFSRRLGQEELSDELRSALTQRYQSILSRLNDSEADA